MARRRSSGISFFKLLLIVVLFVGLVVMAFKTKSIAERNRQAAEEMNNIPEIKVPDDKIATIVGIGDTLCHSPNFKDAYDAETGIYDFSSFFKDITGHFDGTVNVGNCEATFAGAARGYSGYPTFNTPEHLAVDLKELGLDIMTTANNHTLDMGYSGLESTLNYLDEAGLEHTGSARSQEEHDKILFKDLNGIKTAFIAYTYGTNGIPIPAGKEYCVNCYADYQGNNYTVNYDRMKATIDQAKAEGAEAIVASIHWGIEYQTKENAEQDQIAEFLVKNGVNVILGCHPHVPQPLKMITAVDDEGKEHIGACIFSMGNFFSNQDWENTRNTLIVKFQIRKNGVTGEISVDSATYVPCFCYNNGPGAKDIFEILDLDEIIRSHDAGEGKWSDNMYNLALREKERLYNIVGPELDIKAELAKRKEEAKKNTENVE